ncbi:MAG: hypothetical protein A3F40_00050 [Chlamydiae bacterium RIFCSPHIGHO2_12_FULL_27_8]|nr:MAG: hypothetical protein A3F40_00050 [Chlamydiae bacterium RIFCSPHIGHO2_12_FULL_27_8]OGN66902.1 MAG: hypothetical protein A2888_01925 [Chlamydiae bacterium RIFCSPLOWO2_01_FULL_28_7]
MRKIIFTAIFFTINCFSVLPPFYQSKEEIIKILNDPRLHEELGSGSLIIKIEKDNNIYTVYSQKYSVEVEVVYMPTDKLGKQDFRLNFEKKINHLLDL